MSRYVQLTAPAEHDVEQIVARLRVVCGGVPSAWLQRLSVAIDSLSDLPERCHRAAEADDLGLDLRELLFGRRRGTVRILFTIESNLVRVHHLRWAFRRPIGAEDLA